jgi:hypothetical protein
MARAAQKLLLGKLKTGDHHTFQTQDVNTVEPHYNGLIGAKGCPF